MKRFVMLSLFSLCLFAPHAARAQFDNDTDWTGFGVTRSSQSIHANLIYSPFPKLDIGAELIFGTRELESGADGDLRRLHTSVKYSF